MLNGCSINVFRNVSAKSPENIGIKMRVGIKQDVCNINLYVPVFK